MSANENSYDYTLTADVRAPVHTVWQAWTENRHYEAWSYSVPGSVALDVRPGGAWRATVATPDGQEFPITGTYLDVAEDERLQIGMDGPDGGQEIMGLDLADLGDGRTRIQISQVCNTPEARDSARAGSQMLLDSCAGYVTTM